MHSYTAVTGDDEEDVANALVALVNAGVDAVTADAGWSGPTMGIAINSDLYLQAFFSANPIIGQPVPEMPSADSVAASAFSVVVSAYLEIIIVMSAIEFEAVETGPVPGYSMTLSQIVTPVQGWDTAYNVNPAQIGSNQETDPEAQLRRPDSLSAPGSGTVEAIRANLLQLDGVTSCRVLENITDATNSDGLLPHSIEAIIQGGDETEIAEEIWERKGGGINMNGTTTVNIIDSQGIAQAIKFSRPTPVLMWLRVTYTPDTESELPENAAKLIADAALAAFSGMKPGNDVLPQKMIGPVFAACAGIKSMVAEVAPDVAGPEVYQSTPYAITNHQIADFASARVTVVEA
jgi:hypothetical protein